MFIVVVARPLLWTGRLHSVM